MVKFEKHRFGNKRLRPSVDHTIFVFKKHASSTYKKILIYFLVNL